MKTLLLLTLLLLPLLVSAQAMQSFTVQGTVRDKADRAPLPGVTVMEKGTTNGTATDAQGRFTLKTTGPSPRLRVLYLGYVAQEVAITKNEEALAIWLVVDSKQLNEVVVTGLGAPPKRSSVGYSVATVVAEAPGRVAEVAGAAPAALAGKAAGIAVRGASSAPGASPAAPRADAKATGGSPPAQAGVLTAGELNDFGKWKLWPDIAQNNLNEWGRRWQMSPLERYSVQLVTEEGFAVVGVPVQLKDPQEAVLWEAQTDNTGKCELWNGLFTSAKAKKVGSLQAVVDGQTYSVKRPTVFHNGLNTIRVRRPCRVPAVVDIAFVVDATGSMGDEIQYLQAELGDVLAQVKDSLAATTLHLGSVFYRDAGDEYVTRKQDFSADVAPTVDFIGRQRADGGGDEPEAVEAALAVAVNELAWSPEARARLLFLVLDAPPHENLEVLASLERSVRTAAAQGIRIIPIAASGTDKSTEYLMRAMALATNGTYVFLTDDSGVGGAHIKPTTDKFEVELLNNLLVKIITRYAYTTDCRVPMAVPAGTLSGQYPQRPDTATVAAPAPPAKSYFWKCYPNPVADVLHVELEGTVQELFVTDVTGKVLLRALPVQHKAAIQVGSFSTGVYFLQFFTGQRWERARFVVNR